MRAVFAIEVDHPLQGWTRLQGRYSTRQNAKGWLSFVRAAWHRLPLRIVRVNAVEVPSDLPMDGEAFAGWVDVGGEG